MNTQMSQITRQDFLLQMRRRYQRAGRKYKARLLDERVERFGYHRKAAVRARRWSRGWIPCRSTTAL